MAKKVYEGITGDGDGSNFVVNQVPFYTFPVQVEACMISDEYKIHQWEQEQRKLKSQWQADDSSSVKKVIQACREASTSCDNIYVAGVDLSYPIDDHDNACAALVVIKLTDLQIVYQKCEMVQLSAPYIPGFLAFREAPSIVKMFENLKSNNPEIYEKICIVFIDGNGILHKQEFGLACHVGVLLGLATVGVAKNLYQVDGLQKDEGHKEKIEKLQHSGDHFQLIGQSGSILGCALKSTEKSQKPVYISVGNKITLDSAITVVHHFCQYRVPEPIRQADIISREYLREKGFATLYADIS